MAGVPAHHLPAYSPGRPVGLPVRRGAVLRRADSVTVPQHAAHPHRHRANVDQRVRRHRSGHYGDCELAVAGFHGSADRPRLAGATAGHGFAPMTGAPIFELRGLTRHFGEVVAVQEVDLALDQGEFVSLLGPSGSGKTTTLLMVAGLLAPTRGSILLNGQELAPMPPYRRNIGMVFQNY